MLPHGQVNCRLCGRQMDANIASMRNGICRAPACDAERTRQAATAIMERDWTQYRQATAHRLDRAADQIAAVSDRTGIELDELKIHMLPRQTRPMTGPDPEERAAFKTYLREIVDQSFAEDVEPTRAPGRTRHDEPESVFTTASCSTCKGDCCNLGGPHKAFLNSGVVSEFRALHPDWDADQIYQAYEDRLADVTAMGSCQFHGEMGCTLDRDMRAQLCNSHHCRALKYLLQMRGLIGDAPVALIALDEEGDGREASVIENGEWRYVDVDNTDKIDDSETRDRIIGQGLAWLPDVSPALKPIQPSRQTVRECKWCGNSISANQLARTQSCGDSECERQRIVEVARAYKSDG